MNRFELVQARDVAHAVELLGSKPNAAIIAGGTNLVDLMKENVARPDCLVDVTRLPLKAVAEIEDGRVRIGALVSNAALACHPIVAKNYPLLSAALLSGASPQLRNMASVGGNLLQRTRCYYFYDPATACNKRAPGSGCSAVAGLSRIHAILGASEACIAVHPSDMCVALAALEATVCVEGHSGGRRIAFSDFHRLPGETPQIDTDLAADEIITAVELPEEGFERHWSYLKIRDRASYAFALVSVAVGLGIKDGRVRTARIALGGVAHKPWRDPEAEERICGQQPERAAFEAAAAAILRGAVPYDGNAFKIDLARRAIVRALLQAATGTQHRPPALRNLNAGGRDSG